jgi:GntR family transcriptional regulator/MocR family aminotransferase
MAVQQTTSSLDLHVDVDRTRVRASLEDALREAVQSGRLAPGARLPSSRALAADLRVARSTVVDVYEQLSAEGWLVSRHGSATTVADPVGRPSVPSGASAPTAVVPTYDLRAGTPDVTTFPRAEWTAALRTVLAAAPADALGYGDPRGRIELRQALASYLARARGVRLAPDDVVVCSGYRQSLWLLSRVLRAEGASSVAVEAFGHHAHRDVIVDAGLRTVALEVDDDGARPEHLDGHDAVVLTAAHQFPLGVVLSPVRRGEIVRWAAADRRVIVEDDYDGEFRYDRRGVGAMQALAPELVAYAGTASKTLAPGLRLAWLVLPPRLVEPVVELRRALLGQAPVLDQLVLAELLTSGRYDRHVRRTRLAYRGRRDRFVAEMAARSPGTPVLGLPAGLHSVVQLCEGDTEDAAVERASSRGLAVEGLGTYTLRPGLRPPSLVVGWATPPSHSFTAALRRLTLALAG